jgi:N,N'-diacetylchitobiose phosphorylase
MQYGYFDREKKEYVITNPETPTPWINYLGSDKYCALVSNNAGGYSFYLSAKSGRFMRFRYNNLPMDRPGRYLYLRDNASGDFWSASWQPVAKSLSEYRTECRHGLGYTTITSVYRNIETETTYFVPLGENLEIWQCTIKNKTDRPTDLSVFSYAELAVWDALNDLTDFQYFLNVVRNSLVPETEILDFDVGVIVTQGRPRVFAFCSRPLAGFDGDRDVFIGPHHSEANPAAVIAGRSFDSQARGGNACASFQTNITLAPGEEKSMVFVIGVGNALEEGVRYKKKYSCLVNVKTEFHKLKTHWANLLSPFACLTPDAIMNDTLNVLNPYQAHTTFNWSRSASYYESGTNRDGLGYRDSNQDALAVVAAVPERVRERILSLAGAIYKSGCATHTFQPLSGEGTGGCDYSDDHLWPLLTVSAYIKETGDTAVLDEEIPYFYDKTLDTLFAHLDRTIAYSLSRRGAQGLCLGLRADWDDTLNLSGQGESVWTSEMLCLAITIFGELADLTKNKKMANKYEAAKKELVDAIRQYAWDGAWFLRAYTGSGKKVGSSENKYGRIFLNPNTWAVLSGVAAREQAITAMDSVRKLLACDFGLMALSPAFRSFDPELGAITLYPPSLKENGSVFSHTNPWAIMAEAMLGRGELAFKYYQSLAPLSMNGRADIRKTEPYVYTQFLAGTEHQHPGEAKNSWLTGSASWAYVAGTQYILGIRPDYHGLGIDPCIPASWDGFSVRRKYRGTTYDITVKNPHHVCKGIQAISVDGKKIDGNILPVFRDDGKTHTVEAIMG